MSAERESRRVSTGALPEHATVDELLARTHADLVDVDDGQVSAVYPVLAHADRDAWGLAVAGVDGAIHEAGHARRPFVVMSVSKPFVFALVADELGVGAAADLVGMEATGLPFNALESVREGDPRTNPMVNAGAIVTTALVPGATADERWARIVAGLSAFAGHELPLDEETYACARETNLRNRALADLLVAAGGLRGDPDEAVDLYTRQCCLQVTAVDLAVMGATLADGGVQPVTGHRVVDAEVARAVLVAMTVAGLYETSGRWLLDVGVPAKSGIGGGLVAVAPGKGAVGAYSPLLDPAGTPVRGAMGAAALARSLGLDLLASQALDH